MHQVEAQQADRDDVEQRDDRVGEAEEHHAVDVVHRLALGHDRKAEQVEIRPHGVLRQRGLEFVAPAPSPR